VEKGNSIFNGIIELLIKPIPNIQAIWSKYYGKEYRNFFIFIHFFASFIYQTPSSDGDFTRSAK